MPKFKTHRASAKRFSFTATGLIKRGHAYTSHRFHGKTKKQRRQLRKSGLVHSTVAGNVSKMLSFFK